MATFHEQAAKGDASALTTLLAADPDALNSVDADGRTPLHWAAANGHAGAMELLLAASPDSAGNACDVDHQDEGGWTALMSAVSAGHEGAVALLLAAGASPRIANKLAQAPLHFHRGRADMVAALLGSAAASASAASATSGADADADADAEPLDVNAQDKHGATALHRACRPKAGVEAAEALLRAGAMVGVRDCNGNSALHLACEACCEALVPVLAAAAATQARAAGGAGKLSLLAEPNTDGQTPLDYCHTELADKLKDEYLM